MNTSGNEMNMSAIDKALAAAVARKAAKEGLEAEPAKSSAKSKKQAVDSASRQALKAQRDEERLIRRQRKEDARAAKKLAMGSNPPHMKKLDKAAAALPQLREAAQLTFNEITVNYSASEITALALHLQHFNRVKATERALNQTIEAGQTVRIVGGDPKYIGLTGTVFKAQRIRCYVEIQSAKKPIYMFTSDVELLEEQQSATGTEG